MLSHDLDLFCQKFPGCMNQRSKLISKCSNENKCYIKNCKGGVTWTDVTLHMVELSINYAYFPQYVLAV